MENSEVSGARGFGLTPYSHASLQLAVTQQDQDKRKCPSRQQKRGPSQATVGTEHSWVGATLSVSVPSHVTNGTKCALWPIYCPKGVWASLIPSLEVSKQ